jgi:hypothetical protein
VRTGTRNNTSRREAPCRRLDQSTSGNQQSPWASERRRGRHCHAGAALCPCNRQSRQNARSRSRGELCPPGRLQEASSRTVPRRVGVGAYCRVVGNVTPVSDASLLSLRNRALGTEKGVIALLLASLPQRRSRGNRLTAACPGAPLRRSS